MGGEWCDGESDDELWEEVWNRRENAGGGWRERGCGDEDDERKKKRRA